MSRGAILTGFAGGMIGAITSVLGIIWFAAALTIVMSFWSSIFSPFFFGASPATLALVIIVAVLFAVTCILVGIGFYGIGQIGGGAMGTASLIVGIVLGSAFGVLSIVGVLVFPLLSTISYVVLGVTFIIFGAASITMREVTMHRCPKLTHLGHFQMVFGSCFIGEHLPSRHEPLRSCRRFASPPNWRRRKMDGWLNAGF